MEEQILRILEQANGFISLFAVAVIVFGFVRALVRYALRYRKLKADGDFQQFKVSLAKTLTLGLEILVLADLIETITVSTSYQSLLSLTFLIILRTLLSWSLELEIEGRWPWQSKKEEIDV